MVSWRPHYVLFTQLPQSNWKLRHNTPNNAELYQTETAVGEARSARFFILQPEQRLLLQFRRKQYAPACRYFAVLSLIEIEVTRRSEHPRKVYN